MKGFIVVFFLLSYSLLAFSDGWRKGEMEVEVKLGNGQDFIKLRSLRLNGDVGTDRAVVYVTPGELLKIKEVGLEYSVRIADLNGHYSGFWDYRAEYHAYEEIIELMDSLELNFPAICKKYYFGTSLGGRELSALKISDSVDLDQFEAEVAFDGGIHGDEIGGPENMIRFARHLCLEYGNDPGITHLIDNREIWIYPMVNPDGRVNMSRYNMNGVDLNRDWGYMWDAWGNSPDAYSQIESRGLRKFVLDNQFSIHTSYHSGTEVVLYPWYYRQDASPDAEALAYLVLQYSLQSGYSALQHFQGFNLYPTNGTSAESYYGVMGSFGITMEISYDKQPPTSQLMQYYNINLPPMLMLIEKSGVGIKGLVRDEITGETLQAMILVNDFLPVYTDSVGGDYHKFLLPGTYTLKAVANGYESLVIQNVNVYQDSAVRVDLDLTPLDTATYFAHRILACQIPDNNWQDEGNTPGALGQPDGVNYSIGKDGWVIIDMQKPVVDGPGNDIRVYEGDDSPEASSLYASMSADGPWNLVGSGYGTQDYDMLTSGLASARYFKIVDDGDGQANIDDAGFDLDAIGELQHVEGINLVLAGILVNDSSGNNNGHIDAGEDVGLIIEIVNNGGTTANDITGMLQCASSYINITQATAAFGTLSSVQNASGTFELWADASTPIAEPVTFLLQLSASGGTYQAAFSFDIYIGQFPVLIIDMDQNNNSGTVIQSILAGMDIAATYATSIPEELELFRSVFVCLGTFGNNHALNVSEGIQLAGYLNNGGNLYMEGGDTWFFDEPTPVHSMFGIEGFHDGYSDLDLILGSEQSFVSGMHFQYNGDNASIDRIKPQDDAFVLFYNQIPLYNNCIANDPGNYKTVGASFEFGGLEDGSHPSTKENLLLEILDFFGNVVTNTDENHIMDQLNLSVYPNPLRDHASFLFTLDHTEKVTIHIYNISGQNVNTLCDKTYAAGTHKIHWGGKDHNQQKLPAGIYLAKMQVNDVVQTLKIAIIE